MTGPNGEIDHINQGNHINRIDGTYLCAYFTARETITETGLREFLSRELPGYMIPSFFIPIEKLPLTPNGKIDWTALPEALETGSQSGIDYAAPRNSLEERLVEIWQNVLGRDKIGINDNFFMIGGDSITAIRFINLINQQFKLDLKLAELYSHEKLGQLAKKIDQIQGKAEPTGKDIKVNKALEKIEALKNKIMENQ